jgi:hypothetical protein
LAVFVTNETMKLKETMKPEAGSAAEIASVCRAAAGVWGPAEHDTPLATHISLFIQSI